MNDNDILLACSALSVIAVLGVLCWLWPRPIDPIKPEKRNEDLYADPPLPKKVGVQYLDVEDFIDDEKYHEPVAMFDDPEVVQAGRCIDCKYWGDKPYDWIDAQSTGRKCSLIGLKKDFLPDEYDFDSYDEWLLARRKAFDKAGAFVQDASDYAGTFVTQPDFGCVKFVKKD